ncbi:hypothetical protein M1466_01115 [Candidatus Dependentiae bacterium]|nr:hypothetical protein [Candidatus Dependentiae bacterium]
MSRIQLLTIALLLSMQGGIVAGSIKQIRAQEVAFRAACATVIASQDAWDLVDSYADFVKAREQLMQLTGVSTFGIFNAAGIPCGNNFKADWFATLPGLITLNTQAEEHKTTLSRGINHNFVQLKSQVATAIQRIEAGMQAIQQATMQDVNRIRRQLQQNGIAADIALLRTAAEQIRELAGELDALAFDASRQIRQEVAPLLQNLRLVLRQAEPVFADFDDNTTIGHETSVTTGTNASVGLLPRPAVESPVVTGSVAARSTSSTNATATLTRVAQMVAAIENRVTVSGGSESARSGNSVAASTVQGRVPQAAAPANDALVELGDEDAQTASDAASALQN